MRGMSLRAGSMSSRPCVSCACLLVLAICLAGVSAASAAAANCANAQFRSGPSEHLPDCRAYEQVSPVEKDGQDAITLLPVRPAEASACELSEPCTVAYMNVGAAFDGAQGNDFPNAYLATRGAGGWEMTALTPPTPQAPTNSRAEVAYAFSEDLSQTILHVPLQQLTAGAPAGVYNLFLRQPGGAYSLVTASVPAEPPQSGCTLCFEEEDVPAFAGASSDFSHVIFEANDSLVEGAPGGGVENLYEAVAEHVRLVGILPDETIPPQGATAGGGVEALTEHAHELDHAISRDGSRVLFEAAADGGAPDPQQEGKTELYDRIDGAATVKVSAPAPGAEPSACETEGGVCAPGSAEFWAASDDGSLVYFTSKAALTKESNTGHEEASGEEDAGNDLYRYDVETGALTDLTVDAGRAEDPNGADVLGVVGSSEDGSYVYFVADGDLGGGAISGQPNLYVWHGTAVGSGTVTYIATLRAPTREEEKHIEAMRAGAFEYHSDVADWTSRPTESQAYVTPDGRHLAFMSVEPLSGYDNEDQATAVADHEVFEYSAESGRLACASCDAGDVRPLGSAFIGAKLGERVSTPFHQPRSLSDDGSRLFFSSPDPLVPGISGGTVRVFEYENGAVQLISGTESGGSAVLLDASTSGNDVFFATREQLVPADVDELVDVYDARVGGGLAQALAPMPCEGGACREPLSPLPSFSTPASASFAGVGNLAPAAPAAPAKLTRAQLLSRALALCKKLRSKKRRSVCDAVAHRRYAPTVKRARRSAVPKRSRPRR
jgi:hypothetical protein